METLTHSTIAQFLPEHLPSTQERIPDLVCLLQDGRPLHLEIMGYNDPSIANRMYDFRGLFRNAYPLLPPLLQIVVFVGPSEMRMQDRIEEDGLLLRYHLFDIRSLDAGRFQEGTLADALIGILCAGGNSLDYIRRTLQRISTLESDRARRDAAHKFLILSSKRGLTGEVLQESNRMPFTIDTDEDAYLKELVERAVQKGLRRGLEQGRELGLEQGRELGLEQGREQGLERGMEQGIHRGIHQGEVRFFLRSLEVRFGTLPEWVKTKVSEASTETLEAWVDHLHTANTIEDALR